MLGSTPERFLGNRLRQLRGTQVDTVFYCTGVTGLFTSHLPRMGETLDEFVTDSIPLDDDGVLKGGCWNDEPAVTGRLRKWLGAERDYRRHGVLAYSMGDEVESYGSCLHPSCLAAYRLYLQRRYGSIEAVNASWGTSYTESSDVALTVPDDNEEKQAFAQKNFPRWFDRRAFQAWNMADYIGRFGRAAREIDPQTWAGPEGTGWLDDDLDAIVRESSWWILYSIPATEVVRSIVPRGFQYGLWIGYSDFQPYYPLSDFWLNFLRGSNCTGWHRAIRAVGLQFEYVTDRMMRRGEFEADDYKILILSQCEAIGPREAQVIRKFVDDGGTVIADVRPGLYDEYCKPLPAGVMDDLFGVRHTGNVEAVEIDAAFTGTIGDQRISVELPGLHVNPAVELTTARAAGQAGSTPIMMVNRAGRGRAILMNFTMATFPNLSLPETDESAAELIGAMFAQAGVRWPLRMLDPDGARCRNVEAVRWKTGDQTEVVAVYGPLNDGRAQWRPREGEMDRLRAADVPKPVVVQLPRRMHVAQVGSPKRFGRKRTFTIQSHPWRPTFVVLSDGKLNRPVLEPARTAAPRGETLRLRVRVPDALGMHALKVRVTTPQRGPAPWFGRSVMVGAQGATFDLPIAHNEQAGTWNVEATDLYTDKSATGWFTVESGSSGSRTNGAPGGSSRLNTRRFPTGSATGG